ncbi:HAMP domain-containing histidine kinase [Bacillus shivajii]|uniref:sensor histidine kinase n=1 Tax=Bacillus shivajii TaxID=1983719 RepID=UPI001CFA269C|nr:HAMP domain-containing sensor histidine kinase [Bacillus shivajii]UCZ54338.1 HAMP domain-containing histidine kinase [Bacillus shivajii]
MMTCVKRGLVDQIYDKKHWILKELIDHYPFNKEITRDDKKNIELEISSLFDCFLMTLYENTSPKIEHHGIKVENHRRKENIDLIELLAYFDNVRIIIEKWIDKLPSEEAEKTMGKCKLNHFFLELQKAVHLHSTKVSTEELKQKNEELDKLYQERIKTLSKLSSSFAHEIRNPLTSIKGFIQLLESRVDKPSDEGKFINYINKEIEELEEHVNQIMLLSNHKTHQDIHIKKMMFNNVVTQALESFQTYFKEHQIQVSLNMTELMQVNVIEDQLKLAVFKLCQNAIDALLLRKNERRLEVTLKEEEGMAVLTFTNNGPPISGLIKNKIFDPFVSTKELGKGIGLSITRQVIEKHGGHVKFHSNEESTTFEIYLPIEYT